QNIKEIIDFGDLQVFQGATTYPCIFISGKGPVETAIRVTSMKTLALDSLAGYVDEHRVTIDQVSLDDAGWNLGPESEQQLLTKIRAAGIPLGEYVKGKIYRGVLTGLNEAFVIDAATRDRLIAEDPRSAEVIKPFLTGRDIKRYQAPKSDKYLIFFPRGYTNEQRNNKGYPWRWIQENYPAVANYLEPFETKAKKRYDKGDYWWELRACDYYAEFEKPKIIYQVFQVSPCFIWDTEGYFCNNAIWIIPTEDQILLAILNSKLGLYLISKNCTKIQNGYQLIFKYLEKVPIKSIDEGNTSEKPLRDAIITSVDLILQLNKDLQASTLPDQKEQLKARIDHCDEKIDRMVYRLYGLTEEEIKIVENFR
ncbi:MAG: TaqI-like C-terminal specificity domain-containing protein, partial [bacterium]